MKVVANFIKCISISGLFLLFFSCGIQYKFQGSKEEKVDTSYIYSLPYHKGRSHLVIQGYNSKFSHQGRIMLDFKMKKGSPVSAARSGVVVAAIDTFSKGGPNRRYLRRGNNVGILHDDSTQALYGHLQYKGALVKVGDSIKKRQLIAYSGNTGFSAIPHLHFVVWKFTKNGREQLPTRFYTRKGVKYLRTGRLYKSVE